ncbi:MAG: GNAT family N-acetyltransferase [Betaproteobacteria bacterium]|nr:GNAT family N-acetyltransferase [Betaproteobacteria bacterium]
MADIVQASRPEQIEQVRALFREYERWVDEPCCFASFERELAELPGEYGPPAGRLLLALEDGVPAGCAALRRLADGAGEMKRLYVRPAYRGRAIGRALTEAVIAAARAAGCRALLLDTLPKMAPAIALYGALGFAPRGPYAAAPTPGARFFELRL